LNDDHVAGLLAAVERWGKVNVRNVL